MRPKRGSRVGAGAVGAAIVMALVLTAGCGRETPPLRPLPPQVQTALATLQGEPSGPAEEAAAAEVLSFFMRSGSPSIDVLLERAGLAEAHNDLQKAATLIDEAIALKPDFAEAFARRAGLAFARKDFAAALKDLQEAVRLEPRHFAALAGLGAVYEALQRPTEALKAYRQALALYPRFAPARDGEARTARIVEGVET